MLSGGGGKDVMESIIEEGISPLLTETGLLIELELGGRSLNGLIFSLSPNGDALSRIGVPQRGDEFPPLPLIDSIEPRDL